MLSPTIHLTSALVLLLMTFARGQELLFDLKNVLDSSLLFYEAQKAGYLPSYNRVPWRSNACVHDRGMKNEVLTGGYFTDGTTVTFTFPNAAAMTILAWGFLDFEDAYIDAGLRQRTLETILWGADHLVACHPSAEVLYVLLGNVNNNWDRVENLSGSRRAQAITSERPGTEFTGVRPKAPAFRVGIFGNYTFLEVGIEVSESTHHLHSEYPIDFNGRLYHSKRKVAAEAAAALAASSLLLRTHSNNHYREIRRIYLSHARQLFNFAKKNVTQYQNSVPDVAYSYKTWGVVWDELVWAAIWLYRATGEREYLDTAETLYLTPDLVLRQPEEFSWEDKKIGAEILLYRTTLKQHYLDSARRFCDLANSPNRQTKYGMFHIASHNVGALRYASNAAFACLSLGEIMYQQGKVKVNPYASFTLQQIWYALGINKENRSFVVGVGHNPPLYCFHSSASCGPPHVDCTNTKFSTSPNPHVLKGALVGGPNNQDDDYLDTRDFFQNGVALDHNAGFQSAVAGLLSLHNQGRLSTNAYKT